MYQSSPTPFHLERALANNTMATVQQQHHHQHQPPPPPPTQDPQPPLCIGCRNPIEEGSVIAFGDALFHFDWQVMRLLFMYENGF